MRCADATTSVAIKVLKEKEVITEIWIMIALMIEIVVCSFTLLITDEDVQ